MNNTRIEAIPSMFGEMCGADIMNLRGTGSARFDAVQNLVDDNLTPPIWDVLDLVSCRGVSMEVRRNTVPDLSRSCHIT
ncbi:MAG: hypothetical protein WBG92_05170 [Thiohalocapsa sp.]